MSDPKYPDTPDRTIIGNRENNYAVAENQPAGMRIPEHVFRQAIGYGLGQIVKDLAQPVTIIDELFAMCGQPVIKQIKSWLRDHPNIFTGVSWPREDVHLPLVVCINQGEQEETALALLGDQVGETVVGLLEGPVVTRNARAVPMKHTTNIYIATQDHEFTLYLYTLVKFILLRNKDPLTQLYDIHNLVISGQALEFDEDLFPTFGYYRVLQLQYLTLFDFSLSERTSKIVSLDLAVQAIAGEIEIISQVPGPGD